MKNTDDSETKFRRQSLHNRLMSIWEEINEIGVECLKDNLDTAVICLLSARVSIVQAAGDVLDPKVLDQPIHLSHGDDDHD